VSTVYVFADETGNFDFSLQRDASRYFGVGTIVLRDDQPAALSSSMAQLRRDLAWRGLGLDSFFHATTDRQRVRDEVFGLIANHEFIFDATLLEKSKSRPHLRATDHDFYKYAWYYHFKTFARREITRGDSLFVVVTELGTKRSRSTFRQAVNDVLAQCVNHRVPHVFAFWPNSSDACLQVADYCTWAISRKYERNDLRSHGLIKEKIRSEYDLFATGSVHYY
jgi:hypothetical protein